MSHHKISSPSDFDPNGPGLLAELAGEATSKLQAMRIEAEDNEARRQRVHAALNKIFQYFHAFSGHVNNIAPVIKRPYPLDDNTAYTLLKWQNAFADSRKHDLSDAAMLNHVTFCVRLQAPEPVIVSRRWNQFETLKHELNAFGLRSLDDMDKLLSNKSQKETFSVRLAPDFLVKTIYQGNYAEGTIQIRSSNFAGFGAANFKLNPESVTREFLDDIGRFLIGRSDSLPMALMLAK